MSIFVELDQRIAATAFGVGFGVPVHPGRNPAAKAAITPAQLAPAVAADARRKKRRPLSEAQTTVVARVGEMIEQKNWNGLLNIERDALEVADALRRSSPADAAAIYGFLGHAHVTMMTIPVAIYADHGKCTERERANERARMMEGGREGVGERERVGERKIVCMLHHTQSVLMLDETSALHGNMPQRNDEEGCKQPHLSFSPAASVWDQMGRADQRKIRVASSFGRATNAWRACRWRARVVRSTECKQGPAQPPQVRASLLPGQRKPHAR
jgi:hypothetical protein